MPLSYFVLNPTVTSIWLFLHPLPPWVQSSGWFIFGSISSSYLCTPCLSEFDDPKFEGSSLSHLIILRSVSSSLSLLKLELIFIPGVVQRFSCTTLHGQPAKQKCDCYHQYLCSMISNNSVLSLNCLSFVQFHWRIQKIYFCILQWFSVGLESVLIMIWTLPNQQEYVRFFHWWLS